ncbi:MAG TPA: sulfatase [Thermoanaerobaculia bacterium]|nr:sulfatase [Thermoanaerobaculia bacterium]
MRRIVLFIIVGGVLAAGSGCRGEDVAWQRFGLCEHLGQLRTGGADRRTVTCRIAWLGPREVRDPEALAVRPRRAVERLSAGEVRALAQRPGSRLAVRVALGAEPYFSFVPLREDSTPYFRFRVAVRARGERPVLVHRAPAPPPGGTAPAAVAVDLGRWAGEEVELLLEAAAPGGAASGARALWGSPAVYSRRGPPPRAGTRSAERPNVVLLGLDTLRADALGAYGRRPSMTPALDRLAAESDLFLDAFSCFNVTNPSFASLLTGLYGKHHGIYDFDTPLPPAHTTLAEVFAAAGYRTGAVVSVDHLAPRRSGLGQGFAVVEATGGQLAAERGVDWAMDWLAAAAGSPSAERPFFLWLHLFDPHTPHTPPAPFAIGRRAARPSGLLPPDEWQPFRPLGPRAFRNGILGGHPDLYAGEVAYLDRQVDRLLGFLESRGLLATTIVAVVADHGENLEEHGIEYRHAGLWDTTTHVPLFVRWPGARPRGRRLRGLVQNIDLFPTLLGAAKLELPPQDGIDLRRLAGRGRRAVFAEHTGRLGAMVRTREHKYWVSRGNRLVPDGAYLYDVRRDPRERDNLAGGNLPRERALASLLDHWLKERRHTPRPTPRDLPPEERERLRALGYL